MRKPWTVACISRGRCQGYHYSLHFTDEIIELPGGGGRGKKVVANSLKVTQLVMTELDLSPGWTRERVSLTSIS